MGSRQRCLTPTTLIVPPSRTADDEQEVSSHSQVDSSSASDCDSCNATCYSECSCHCHTASKSSGTQIVSDCGSCGATCNSQCLCHCHSESSLDRDGSSSASDCEDCDATCHSACDCVCHTGWSDYEAEMRGRPAAVGGSAACEAESTNKLTAGADIAMDSVGNSISTGQSVYEQKR